MPLGGRAYRGAIDHEKLGAYLRALSVPTRILLLQKLQWPQTPSEIELPPYRKDRGLGEDRALSRQTVEEHLRKLEEVGLVRSRAATRAGQPVREYLLDTARLFVVVDELRRLGVLRAAAGNTGFAPGAEPTVERLTTPAILAPSDFWVRVSNACGTTDSWTATVTPSVNRGRGATH